MKSPANRESIRCHVLRNGGPGRPIDSLNIQILLVWLLLLAGDVLADEPAGNANTPLADSASPVMDREAQQKFQRLADLIQSSSSDENFNVLRTLISPGEGFVELKVIEAAPDGPIERFVGVRPAVRQLFRQFSADALRHFRRQIAPLAEAALREATSHADPQRLRNVIVQFPDSHAAFTALETLAARLLDQGDWRAAEVAFSRSSRHPVATATRRIGFADRMQVARRQQPRSDGHRLEIRHEQFPTTLNPEWQKDSESGRRIGQLIHAANAIHAEQSIAMIPRMRPVVAGDFVITREQRQLTAYRLGNGESVWTAELPGTSGTSPLAINPSLQHLVSRSMAKQLQIDTVQSRVVVDRDLVFTAESPGEEHRSNLAVKRGLADIASPGRNGIVARRLTDGEVLWTLSASEFGTPPANTFFPGPPTVVDNEAFGLVQIDEQLSLYAVSRGSGDLHWVLPIAETPRISPADIDWHAVACPVIEVGGTLVCPTAAGLIVGVDLVTRTPLWAVRFPRADVPPFIPRLPSVPATARRHWWSGWREVEFAITRDSESGRESIVLAGPDSESLLSIDPRDGAVRWQRRFKNPLYLAGFPSSGTIVVVGRHAVTGLDPRDGSDLWQTSIPEPVGRGTQVELVTEEASIEPHHVLPVKNGFIAIREPDGARLRLVGSHGDSAGGLAFADGRFVMQDLQGMTTWRATDGSEPGSLSESAPLPTDALTPLLERHIAARDSLDSGDLPQAFREFGELLKLNPSSEIAALSAGPARRGRHDWLIQGELLDLIEIADAQTRRQLRQQFDDWARQSIESADPFAVQRFVDRWRGIPWVGELAVRDEARIGLDFARSQLDLLRLAEQQTGDHAVAAAQRLAELYESRSYSRDAEAVRRAFDLAEAEAADSSPWPDREPTVSEQQERQADVGFRMIPVECQPGTLFERLNVAVSDDTRGMRVRFFGDGNSGYWQISLPRSNSAFRGFPMLSRGWGVGHFLVLRVGAELFGITPYDTSGEPRARILWTRNLAEHQRLASVRFDASRPGFSINDLTLLDEFDRPIAGVFGVSAGTVCYQSGGKLICLETASGRRLWERGELPRNSLCTGDGQTLWLIGRGSGDVTVLRTIDGTQTGEFRLSDVAETTPGSVVADRGHLVVVGESPEETASMRYSRLAVVDLRDRRVCWTRESAAGSKHDDEYFAIGTHWLGRIADILPSESGRPVPKDPEDRAPRTFLSVIEISSGQTVSRFPVERPSGLKTAFCTSDVESHVIALTETDELSFQQPRSVYRNPPLSGTLLAIDSRDGTLVWQRRLSGVRLALDQPKNAPFVVLKYERKRAGTKNGFDSVLQIVDRRTGNDLRTRRGGTTEDQFFIELNAPQKRASIRFARRSIRLDYSPID